MASRGTKMFMMVTMALAMTMLWGGAAAQSGCTTALVGLAPCLNYISGSSTTPSSSCCSQLASIVQSQPQCLCQVLNGGGSSLGVSINQTQALTLPGACKVQTPPVSQCNTVNQPSGGPSAATPVGSPTSSPADASTPEASATPTTPSTVSSSPSAGTRSKSTTGSTSDGNMTKLPLLLSIFLLFITSTASSSIIRV